MAITASGAPALLIPLVEQGNNDRLPVEIISKKDSAVLMALADCQALGETAHLLRTPANAAHPLESIALLKAAQLETHELSD